MQWARGIIRQWGNQSGAGVIDPDPRLVLAAMALGIIAGALLL